MPGPTVLELPAVAPFDLQRTVAALRRRPSHKAEALVDGEYRRVVMLDGRERLIGVLQTAPDRVRVRALDGTLDGTLDPAAQRDAVLLVNRLLGLSFDLAPVYAALTYEQRLVALAAQVSGMKPPCYDSLWVTIFSAVPFQQVSIAAGTATLNRLIERLGTRHEYDGRTYYAYPTAGALCSAGMDALRACGLSQAKTRTLLEAATRILDGRLDEAEIAALDDAGALAALTHLPGIGPWTARLILLRGFRRLSLFPLGDSGAARNFCHLFDVSPTEAPAALDTLLAQLGPYRGYLYFLLLASSLLRLDYIVPDTCERPAKLA